MMSQSATSSDHRVPIIVGSPAALADVRACAERRETACGDGSIIWHIWGKGRPLLLLHGGSGSWTHWVRNIGALVAAGYQVIAPDLPGFGDSALTPEGRDGDAMPPWLNSGLTSLIGSEACQIVGFSFGAMVGTLLAAAHPERVRSLILVGAPALSDTPMPRIGLRVWQHLPRGAARNAMHHHNLAALMLAKPESIDELALSLHADNLERDRLTRRRLARTDIVVRTLPKLQCPVDGLWGALDAVYREREHTIEPGLKSAPLFGRLVMLPDTGHWVQYESAAVFNETVIALLAEQQQRAG